MSRQASHVITNRILVSLILVGMLLSACQFIPQPPPPTPTPTTPPPSEQAPEAALPTPEPEEPTPTAAPPPPTTAPGFAPGTIVVKETNTLSAQAANEAEMTFESVAFQAVRIETNVIGGMLEYELQLIDKFGNFLASLQSTIGRNVESIAEFTLPYEGEYRIVVTPIDGEGSLQVMVTALGPSSGGGVLEGVDDAVSALISSARVYHTYQFPLTEGDVVTIAARANVPGAPDTRLVLYGPDGKYVTEIDDAVPTVDLDAVLSGFVATATGTYTAIVTNYGDSIGAYIFSVSSDTEAPEAEGEPDIAYDHDYRGEFFDQSNLSLTFDGYIGEVVQVLVYDTGPDLDVDIYLYSPFEQIIGYARDARQGEGETLHEIQLPYEGRYRVELRPIGSGEASFKVARLTQEALTGGGAFGDAQSGTLQGYFQERNVFHIYQFNASANDKVSLTISSTSETGELDIGFAVLGPNGLQLTFADHSDGDNPADPALLQYQLSQTGTYTVIVYTFNDATGIYEITYLRE